MRPRNIRRRHNAIWPELSALLHDRGLRDYAIFLDETTLSLFAVVTLTEDHRRAALADHPMMRRWWDHMAPLMDVEPGNRPKEWPLTRVFHLA